jgi:hypothetical protein
MERWAKGYTQAELNLAQERYGLRFPPDLVELLLDRRPVEGPDWRSDDKAIRQMLRWPFDLLLFDVDHGAWWPDWGARPKRRTEQIEVLKDALDRAPRLIPLVSHRFLPETPAKSGNPVFSMHGFDTIYYGANLKEYFANEYEGGRELGPVRRIPFWSDVVERSHEAYGNPRSP